MSNFYLRPRRWFGRLASAAVLAGGLGMFWQAEGIRADDPAPTVETLLSTTYIGKVEGGKIGVVATPTDFLAYICGGDDAFNGKCSRWLKGTVANGKLAGEAADGSKIEATLAADAVKGTVTLKNGTKLAFTAPRANTESTLAGLYRAEEKDASSELVAGWIIDEKDEVFGAANNKKNGQIGTLQPPKGTSPANVATQGGTRGQPVNDPKNPPTGKKVRRFGPEEQKDKLAELQANVSDQGGSPIAALVVQQVKRFQQTGGKAGSDLEKKTFAKLKKLPGASLNDYIKNWEKIPLAVRNKATGGTPIDPSTPLTRESAKAAFKKNIGSAISKAVAKNAAPDKPINRVRAAEIHCTNKTDLGKDEVFATYVVTTGASSVDKTTAIYSGFRKGDAQPFKAADNLVFPAGGAAPATEDVLVQAALFDDDSADKARTQQLITSLVSVAVDILKEVTEGTGGTAEAVAKIAAKVVDDFNKAVETIVAAFPDTVFMGSDAIIATTKLKTESVNGTAKDQLVFRKLKNNGNVKFQYEIRGLRVE